MSNDRRDALLAEVYEELRAAATRIMRRDADIVTMQPTELVNEAAIRVVGIERMAFADRQHMLATCVRILRQTMIDQIRRKRAQKRQAPEVTVVLAEIGRSVDIDELGDLLERLETIAPEYAQVIDLRFFVGLTIEEIALTLGVAPRTIDRRWRAARAWLAEALDANSR